MQGIVDFLGEYPMKKLCLVSACLLAGLAPTLASADTYGDFVRVECNRSMGFFDIQYNSLPGSKIFEFLDNRTPVFFYRNPAPNMDSDIMIINNFSWSKQPFTYKCELTPFLRYDITVSPIDQVVSSRCQYSSANTINIIEHATNKKTGETIQKHLVKDISLGCESPIQRISGVAGDRIFEDDLEGVDLAFATVSELAYFMMSEQENPIDKEAVKMQGEKLNPSYYENSSAAQ